MAILTPLRQAALLAAVLAVTVAANDEDPIPAVGPSFAQGAVKFQGKALLSEVMPPDPMDQFANLNDIFDDKALDMEAEPSEFSMAKLLKSPSLYFTIALIVGGGLLFTSGENPALETQQATVAAEPPRPRPTPKLDLSKLSAAKQAEASPATQGAAVVAAAVAETPAEQQKAPTKVEALSCEVETHEAEKPNALLAAADACRAGQAGSYANFCKLLAAQSNVQ